MYFAITYLEIFLFADDLQKCISVFTILEMMHKMFARQQPNSSKINHSWFSHKYLGTNNFHA